MLLFQLVGVNLLAGLPPPPPRPITEVDVYQDMAKFFELAGAEESLLVSAGTGYVRDGIATIDVSYRHRGFPGLWELLPTTIGVSLWGRTGDDHAAVTASIGYTLVLGLFGGPYVTANALGQWSPQSSSLGAGFDTGLGYELRASKRWSFTADARVVKLWPIADAEDTPWGGRITLGVRRYIGL